MLGPLLTCGHYAIPREWLRRGPMRWCETCCQWVYRVDY